MKLLKEEPRQAVGVDQPGTIKKVYCDNNTYFISILCGGPGTLSNTFKVSKNDADLIAYKWEQGVRVTITKVRVEKGIYTAARNYRIVPNVDMYPNQQNFDVTI